MSGGAAGGFGPAAAADFTDPPNVSRKMSSCASESRKVPSQTRHTLFCWRCSCLDKDKEGGLMLLGKEEEKEEDCTNNPMDKVIQTLATDISILDDKIKELTSTTLPKLSEKQEEFEKNVDSLRTEISSVFREMREAIDEREETLLIELESIYEQTSNAMTSSILGEVEKALDIASNSHEALKRGGVEERHGEFIEQVSLVHSEIVLIDELMCRASTALRSSSLPQVEFRYDKGALEGLKVFGSVGAAKSVRMVRVRSTGWNRITLSLDGNDMWKLGGDVWNYEVWMRGSGGPQDEEYKKLYEGGNSMWTAEDLLCGTSYDFRVCAKAPNGDSWSEEVTVETSNVEALDPGYCWRACPTDCGDENGQAYDGSKESLYHVDKRNPRVATKMLSDDFFFSTITGSTPLPPGKVIGWGVRILKSASNNGDGISVGVAPANIDLDADDNYERCGWYLDCYNCTLTSGPPHNYGYPGKAYGPEGLSRKPVRTNSVVRVVVDTANGELAFILDDVNYGTAFSGIPLDNPLVPCVILGYKGDCIELI